MGLSAITDMPTARADGVADVYKGKVVRIIVGVAPGGLYDIHARLMARYLGKHLPGNPTVIVENMTGAGSLKATLYLYNAAPKDGTMLGVIGRGMSVNSLLDPETFNFDSRRFNWLGSTSRESAMGVAWHTAAAKTFDQLFATPLIVGATGAGDESASLPRMLNTLFNTKIKIISGYTGGTTVLAAMEKGEVEGRFWSWGSVKSERAQWLEEKKINLLVQVALNKASDLPDTPFIMDYAKTDEQKQVLQLALTGQSFAWPMLAPPGVPAETVAALRAGYKAAANDPAFLAEGKRANLSIIYVSGEEIHQLIDTAYAMPPDIIKRTKEIFAVEPAKPDAP